MIRSACTLGALWLLSGSALAAPITLLSLDFESLTLPDGSVVSSPDDGAWVNVRSPSDRINSGDDARTSFNSFFDSALLVLGDRAATMRDSSEGTSSVAFPLLSAIPLTAAKLTLSYDWIFDATTSGLPDDFMVEMVLGEAVLGQPLQFVGAPRRETKPQPTRGSFSTTVKGSALAGLVGADALRLTLVEFEGGASSAVGLDNILLVLEESEPHEAPEPGTLGLLLGAGSLGLALARARRRLC